jgi:hypothetical protein
MKSSRQPKDQVSQMSVLESMNYRQLMHDHILLDLVCTLSKHHALLFGQGDVPGFANSGKEFRDYSVDGVPEHVDGLQKEELKKFKAALCEFFDDAINRLKEEQALMDRVFKLKAKANALKRRARSKAPKRPKP